MKRAINLSYKPEDHVHCKACSDVSEFQVSLLKKIYNIHMKFKVANIIKLIIFIFLLITINPSQAQVQKISNKIHSNASEPTANHSSAMYLYLPGDIPNSVDAIPIGNGLSGGLLWGSGSNVYLSLDRGDLWDLRTHPSFANTDFTYKTVVEMAQANRTDELNKQYAKSNNFPTKVPGARLVIELPAGVSIDGFALDLRRAIGTAKLKGASPINCIFSDTDPVAMVKIPGVRPVFKLVGNPCFKAQLKLEDAEVTNTAESSTLVQKVGNDFKFVIHVQAKQMKDETILAISIVTSKDGKDPLAMARKRTAVALKKGYESLCQKHEAWWEKFWAKSSVQIPDSAIQLQYNMVQYYYGAASRQDSPPIPLQGVWSTDNGKIPTWYGDYHHDLNTELTYWAYLNAGRFDQGLSYIDFMWSLKPVHEEFARTFFGVPSGLIVPGVMALDGKPMGSWFQYTLSPTMGAWVSQSFYQHWRYTMDKGFLAERAYPYCTGIGEALLGLMRPDPTTGKLKLPLSTAPEMHNNTQAAWLTPNTNSDLAILRWLFAANADMACVLNRSDDAKKWKAALLNLDELATEGDTGALKLSPDESQTTSHRHFSHLMAIYPLGILNVDGTVQDSAIIDASLQQLEQLGENGYCGYSHSWLSCMKARVGRPEQALESLHKYMAFTTRSGFHCNWIKRPVVTLEGNFAASQAVHEMLLQSWGGKLRIFPAVPQEWKDASFESLRAEGGFIVSANRIAGKTVTVSITATVDQSLQMINPFGNAPFHADREFTQTDNLIRCNFKANQTLTLKIIAQ
jgi:alpha-L-fucosidase 2